MIQCMHNVLYIMLDVHARWRCYDLIRNISEVNNIVSYKGVVSAFVKGDMHVWARTLFIITKLRI